MQNRRLIMNDTQQQTIMPDPKFMRDVFNDLRVKGYLRKCAYIIEKTFESFGITAQIIEVNIESDSFLYIAKPLESVDATDITKHEKDIAIALAAHGGNVCIQAPMPGKDVFGVFVPRINDIGYKAVQAREQGKCLPIGYFRRAISTHLLRISAYFFRSVEDVYFQPQLSKYHVLHKYKSLFRKLSNEGLVQALNQEIGNKSPTWERPFIITAIQMLFEKRGLDYSAIAGIPGGLSLYKPVRLEGKKVLTGNVH